MWKREREETRKRRAGVIWSEEERQGQTEGERESEEAKVEFEKKNPVGDEWRKSGFSLVLGSPSDSAAAASLVPSSLVRGHRCGGGTGSLGGL